jgi:hypothetical protein
MAKKMSTLTDAQLERLGDELHDALNPRGEGADVTWECEHDHVRTIRILDGMGLSWEEIDAAVAELTGLGGHCDCEVLFNVLCIDED